jgi:F-type H+-transporting ATPase subunit epsilon
MATKLKLEIVTPDSKAYSDEVDMVVIPGGEGQLGILPNHVPLLTELQAGEVKITKDGQVTELVIGRGFAEITQDHVNVLTDMALEEHHIDERAAEEAIKRAQAALQGKDLHGEEIAEVEASLARSLAQLKFKRRRRQL